MLKIFHVPRTRSHRIVWLCEEMGVPYQSIPAEIGAPSPELAAVNPLGNIPVLQDGDVTMLESIAIMQYIMGKYGPTRLARAPSDPDYAAYLQYLLFGEAGITMYGNLAVATRFWGPEDQQNNWTVTYAKTTFGKRLDFVASRLGDTPYILGDEFSAADISVGYPIGMAKPVAGISLSPKLQAYHDRLKSRLAYQRALAAA